MKKITIGIIAVIVLIVLYGWSSYNSLITLKENATAQLQQVDTLYQRRFDLIPGLVESVKGAMKQEQTIFKDIADARSRYAGSSSLADKASAAQGLESSISRLLVVMENYPTLKSSETVRDFMTQYEGTENRISTERQRYNTTVKDYQLAVKRFPKSIIANMFGFSDLQYFEAKKSASDAPEVKF